MKNQVVINLLMQCCKNSIFITHTLTCGGDSKKWTACCITCCIPLIASIILQEQWICYDSYGKMNYGNRAAIIQHFIYKISSLDS